MAQPKRRRPEKEVDKVRVNEKISASTVRVIDDEGSQAGILSIEDAMSLAETKGLDLVEVSDKSTPPVCRIMDYGKYKYQISKKLHEAKKKQVVIKIKEIKMRPKTEEHDYQFKLKHARGFLVEGNKVKVTVQYRGREMAYAYLGIDLLNRFAQQIEDIGQVEQKPVSMGRIAQMIISPKKN